MPRRRRTLLIFVVLCALTSLGRGTVAQSRSTIDSYLSPGYPFELVSAKKADRIAWLAFERGMRNVYTAAPPAFAPVRVTRHLEDDGIDLTNLSLSDDGATAVFVRGHAPNRRGWVANPTSNPDGAERTIWAARTAGGPAWKIAEGGDPELSPDGRAVLYVKDDQIYRAAVSQAAAVPTHRHGASSRSSRMGRRTAARDGRRTARRSRSSASATITRSSASTTWRSAR